MTDLTPATPPPDRTRIAAYGLIEEAGSVLLVRIGAADPWGWGGLWTLPGGGLDFGERPDLGARREVEEETGLTAQITGIAGVTSHLLEAHETRSGARLHSIWIVYRMRPIGGLLRPEPDGTTDLAAWHPRAAIAALPTTSLVDWALTLPMP